jgi:uncharacterized membrane-anchored protein YitT (DUF2179 family)
MPLLPTRQISLASTHITIEDLQAIFTGTFLVAIGVTVLSKADLVTGGVVGVVLLLHQLTGFRSLQGYHDVVLPYGVIDALDIHTKFLRHCPEYGKPVRRVLDIAHTLIGEIHE